MDTEQFELESFQELSNSPGSSSPSSSSSPRSLDSDIEATIQQFVENGATRNANSDDEDDDENGEFMSGGEEFEEEVGPGAGSEAPFVEPLVPVARASAIDSDDDDDDIVGGVVKEGNLFGSVVDKGLKMFGVSGSEESVKIGEVGGEEAPKPVMAVKGLGENGGFGEFLKGGGVGDTLHDLVRALTGGGEDKGLEKADLGSGDVVEDKVLEIPKSGSVDMEDKVLEIPNLGSVDVEDKVVEGSSNLDSEVDKVEPVIVESGNENLNELDDVEFTGKGDSVVEGSTNFDKVELVIVESENEKLGEPDVVEASTDFDKVEPVIVESRNEKLGEPDVVEASTDFDKAEPVIVESGNEKLGEPDVVEASTDFDKAEPVIVESGNEKLGEPDVVETSTDFDKADPVIVEYGNEKLGEPDVVETSTDFDKVEPVIVESGNEKLGEPEVVEVRTDFDKVEPLIVESGNEKLGEPDVVEFTGGYSVVEASTDYGSEIDKVEPMMVESGNEKLGEPGKVDSVVEAIHVDLLASGEAVVGAVEENKYSEIKEKESEVVTTVSVDNVFEQIRADAEEPEKIAELSMDKILETTDATPVEKVKLDGEISDGSMKIINDPNMSVVVDEKVEASADESQTVGLVSEAKPATEVERTAASDAEQIEPSVEALSSYEVDGDATKLLGSYAEPVQTNATDDAEHTVDENLEDSVTNEEDDEEEDDEEEDDGELDDELDDELGGSVTDEEDESMIFGSSEAARQFLEQLEQRSGAGSHSAAGSSQEYSQRIDGQIATDSDEEVDTDDEGDGKEMFDSAALAALLKAATGADSGGGNITVTGKDGSKLFSVERPAGLGSSLRSVKPTSWSNRPNLFSPSTLSTGGDSEANLSEEEKQKLEKMQQIRVKFLRLVQRLGFSPEDQIAAQVLYRLALVAGRQTSQLFNLDVAKRSASQLEEDSKDDLNFSLNILVLGKTGVGKSSTINSIFGEEKSQIDAFECTTTTVKEISGTVDGVKIRVFDTPGLKSSVLEQGFNRKVLSSVKRFTKKCPPDIVLYVDRLDTQTRDLNDLPLLRTITSTLGPSIWRSAIVTLTHASCAPPDGPTGNPLSYEVFVAQRSHIVQQSIGQAVGDLRMMNPSSMNPVSLVENHPSCRKNREGLKVLPNGLTWKPQLLFLCYSMKILSEASSLTKPQDPLDHRKLFGFRVRAPPLPYLLSWLLQSRTHPKLLTDQGHNDVDSDIVVDESDQEEEEEEDEDEYDQLPPFRPLTKEQLKMLGKEQKNAYFDEYEYRVKLLQKKQWREMKKGKMGSDEIGEGEGERNGEGNGEGEEASNDGIVSVPLPDMVLPHTFDGDNPAYRYRFLEPQSQLLTRPVLDTHGWDHDCGYDGVNVENRALAIANQYPASVAVQITKDKKEFNLHLDSSISAKHGENGSSMAGFDIQNIGKQLAYTVRAETKFKNHRRNKTTAGASVTFLGENVATGVKVEDQLALGKRIMLIGSTGTVRSRGDAAYGANLEMQLRDADFPIVQDQSSLGLSLVKWRGDLALGANLQSQISVGRGSKVTVRAGLNNKRSGQISVTLSSTEQLQLALVGIVPLARAIYKNLRPGFGEIDPIY